MIMVEVDQASDEGLALTTVQQRRSRNLGWCEQLGLSRRRDQFLKPCPQMREVVLGVDHEQRSLTNRERLRLCAGGASIECFG